MKCVKRNILLAEKSPYCPIEASVEADGDAVYFYLYVEKKLEERTIKQCWVRNLTPAPSLEADYYSQDDGGLMLLPESHCRYPQGQPSLNLSEIKIVWLENGNGAALLEKGEVLAIIPSDCNSIYCPGYARDCIQESTACKVLSEHSILLKEVEVAQIKWREWETHPNPFYTQLPEIVAKYTEILGNPTHCEILNKDEWPPIKLYTRNDQLQVFTTAGMSLHKQPKGSVSRADLPYDYIELGLLLENTFSSSLRKQQIRWMENLTVYPWREITRLKEGSVVKFDALDHKRFSMVLLTNQLDALPKVNLPKYKGKEAALLWLVPLSNSEIKYIERGKSSAVLFEKLNAIGKEIFNLNRADVV